MSRTALVAIAILALATHATALTAAPMLVAAPTPAEAPPAPVETLDLSSMRTGDIIPGRPSGDGCWLDVAFVLEGSDVRPAPTARFERNDDCTFTLILEETEPTTPPVAQSTCGPGIARVTGNYWMYGFGGPSDKLTELYNSMSWTWNCGGAAWNGQTAWCGWSVKYAAQGWVWANDGCWDYGHNSLGQTISSRIGGDFHCSPPSGFPCNGSNPDGYYHHLDMTVNGQTGGGYSCPGWYSGHIVFGVTTSCVKT